MTAALETFFEVVVKTDNIEYARRVAEMLNTWAYITAEVREVAK